MVTLFFFPFDCKAPRQAPQSSWSMMFILHSVLSFSTVSFQVFLGRPRGWASGTCSTVILLIQSELLDTCPNHLSLDLATSVLIDGRSSLLSRVVDGTLSLRQLLHIQRIIALSVRCSRSISFFVVGQHSAAWIRVLRTQVLKRWPLRLKENGSLS